MCPSSQLSVCIAYFEYIFCLSSISVCSLVMLLASVVVVEMNPFSLQPVSCNQICAVLLIGSVYIL